MELQAKFELSKIANETEPRLTPGKGFFYTGARKFRVAPRLLQAMKNDIQRVKSKSASPVKV